MRPVVTLVALVAFGLAVVFGAHADTMAQEATGGTEETLFAWTIPAEALPTGDVEAVFYRLSLPAGVSLPVLAGPFCG